MLVNYSYNILHYSDHIGRDSLLFEPGQGAFVHADLDIRVASGPFSARLLT